MYPEIHIKYIFSFLQKFAKITLSWYIIFHLQPVTLTPWTPDKQIKTESIEKRQTNEQMMNDTDILKNGFYILSKKTFLILQYSWSFPGVLHL